MIAAAILALSEADQPMLLWWVLAAAIAIGPALHSWIKVYEFARGKRSDLTIYVTKTEMTAIRAERDEQLKNTLGTIMTRLTEMGELVRTLQEEMPNIHHALGRLEGQNDSSPSMSPLPAGRAKRRRRAGS